MATVLNFPTLSRQPGRLRWRLVSNNLVFQSPLTGGLQTAGLPGARWGFTIEFPRLLESDAALLEAFLVSLRGQENRFRYHNPSRPEVRGVGGGTGVGGVPDVEGGGQTGTSLNVRNATPSKTGWLLPGDYFSVNGELKMVTANVNSNALGQATIMFEPALRASPVDTAPITLSKPTAVFILANPEAEWDVVPKPITEFTIEAVEFFT